MHVDDKWLLLGSGFLPQFVSHVRLAYGEGKSETAQALQMTGPSNGASKEMGQEHLADCSSMGLAVSMCVFSHCVSVYESIPVSVWVFRCVWSTAGTCINPVTIPYLDICSCYHGWLHCRYRITSLNTKNPSSVCKRKTNAYVSLNVSLKVRLFLLGFSLDSCKV